MESNARMLRLFLIVVLTVSMFVDRACPVPLTGQSNTTGVVPSTKNAATAASNADNNDTVVPADKPVENKKAESSNNASTKENCNSAKEPVDMLNCHVTPHDNDDLIESNSSSMTTATTTIVSNTTKASDTESQKQKVPSDKNGTSDKNKEEIGIVPINPIETTHETTYEVVSTETSHPVNANVAGNDSKVDMNRTDVSISSVAPLVVASTSNVEPEVVEGVKSSDRSRKRSMPSGTIALVTAISFAIVIAIAYVGMIVWRRYIEYRYGHRELLVNELEFDTNDLRHFEL
ncbi:uncharacterized protein LOC128875087 isoform X2 [Hylaeus volcanicus]|uniref:uncharacterized protein LOC128875087 isoform X2 n=1 Tax=Hylaeus volcanicus TaxID=313075 RepID=UPI0023B84522|nr:uncharacterized protein LOC128875087 isoform X2 [Hylaeus volcanicus]